MDLYSKKTDGGKNPLQSKSLLEHTSRTRSNKNDDLRMLVSLSKAAPAAKVQTTQKKSPVVEPGDNGSALTDLIQLFHSNQQLSKQEALEQFDLLSA